MISSEVQRTLVKSPPELWAELSDPAALARHLGELGEIRITRTEPEKLVEWEAEGTKGTVAIKASGWGTKVTLSVSRELPALEATEPETVAEDAGAERRTEAQATLEPETESEAEPASIDAGAPSNEPSSTAHAGGLDEWTTQEAEQTDQPSVTAAERFAHDDPEPLLGTRLEAEDVEPDEDDPAEVSSGPLAESSEPTEPRRGFLARLFGRRRKHAAPIDPAPVLDGAAQGDPSPEPSISAQAAPEPLDAPEPPLAAEEPLLPVAETIEYSEPWQVEPEVSVPDDEATEHDSPVADIAAELQKAEEAASEEVTAVLTGMLDRLGAAHHRPFSRA
jgi:hypothetical protein